MEGRFDEAIREMLRARELDPLSPSIDQSSGLVLITRRVALTKPWRLTKPCSKPCPNGLWTGHLCVDAARTSGRWAAGG